MPTTTSTTTTTTTVAGRNAVATASTAAVVLLLLGILGLFDVCRAAPPQPIQNRPLIGMVAIANSSAITTVPTTTSNTVLPPQIFPENSTEYKFIIGNDSVLNTMLHMNTTTMKPLPEVFPVNNSNYKLIPSNETIITGLLKNSTLNGVELPPIVFPADPTRVRMVTNNTVLTYLLDHDLNETVSVSSGKNNTDRSKIDTEVPDMISGKVYNGESDVDQILPEFTTPRRLIGLREEDATVKPKSNSTLADQKLRAPLDKPVEHERTGGVMRGEVAGILVGVFVMVAVFGYVTLVLWRKSLEYRYGNREMLVNEEDFEPQFDNRFELPVYAAVEFQYGDSYDRYSMRNKL